MVESLPELPHEKYFEFREYLQKVGFKFEQRPHQVFLARSGKLVVSLYESGKVVIAGKDPMLEREVRWYLSKLGVAGEDLPGMLAALSGKARIGTDEAGKGDYFGPLVVAGALVDERTEKALLALGTRDSKTLSNKRVMSIDRDIKNALGDGKWEVLRIDPEKYNAIYSKMGNLNRVLAWAHARIIENILKANPDCGLAVVDEFSSRALSNALMEKGKSIRVVQSVRGERDVAVAAASVLARAEFLRRMERMGGELGMELPRGASDVEEAARQLVGMHGKEMLSRAAKLHFRTTNKILK